jgi:hypothetical protein
MSTNYTQYLGAKRCCDLKVQGPQGAQGAQGQSVIGGMGYQGSTGATGPQGATGRGCRGATGAQGYQGATGQNGSAGGNGGLPLYLNYTDSAAYPPPDGNTTSLLSPIIHLIGGTTVTYPAISGPSTFQTFISDIELQPQINVIPQGVYTLNLYAYVSSGEVIVSFIISVYNIVSYTKTPIVAGSPHVIINNVGGPVELYTIFAPGANVPFDFDTGDRILAELICETTSGSPDLFVDYEYLTAGNGYSFIQTTLIPRGETGAQGAQGFQGSTGAQGFQGLNGATGAQGFQGSTGAQGFQGLNGVTGAQGFQGSTGAQGFQGSTGAQGFQGSTGAQGFQGTTGAQGSTGAQGFQGTTGAQGFQGATGAQGVTGAQGFQGPLGVTGAQGLIGVTGAQGLIGVTGAQGLIGVTGAQGPIGVTGAQGFQGETGPAQPNFYTNYTITQITGPTGFNIPALTSSPDYYNVYQVDTTSGPITINLPLISSLDNSQKRIHYIVDSAGQLSNNNLIITPTPSNTIGGESSATIVVDYSSVQIMSNTTDKWLII